MIYIIQKVELNATAPALYFVDKSLLSTLPGITSAEVNDYIAKLELVFQREAPFGIDRHCYVWETLNSEVIYFLAKFDNSVAWDNLLSSPEMENFQTAKGELYLAASWADLGYRIITNITPELDIVDSMPVLTVAEAEALWVSAA